MKKARRNSKTKKSFWRYLFFLILIFAVSTTTSFLYLKPKFAFKSPFIENIESQRLKAKPYEDENGSRRLYKSPAADLSENNKETKKDILLVTAEDIIKKYIQPYGVKLLDLYMDKNGTIYADFSDELIKNYKGDALAEYQLIAGLYKNIRENIPDFSSLMILIDGKEADSFGGHIDISRPIGEAIEKPLGRKIEDTI